jgi:PKD repeat protein
MRNYRFDVFKQMFLLVGLAFVVGMSSCKKDEEPLPDPIASFQYEISTTNYLQVSFTNFSLDAATFSWDFGDGSTSVEENPVHTFPSEGTYTVVLTAFNGDGVGKTFSQDITITDPDAALKLLTGEVSKTWRLYRIESGMGVGPNLAQAFDWWSLQNDGSRPCVYQQEFTFKFNGDYVFDDKGSFWGDDAIFPEEMVTCFAALPENMVDKTGNDVSAWLGGTHSFEYTPSTGMVTLTGLGAWIGIPKVGTAGEVTEPQTSVTFKISIEQFDGYDLMDVLFIYDWGVWAFKYASYSNPSLEPAVVSLFVDFDYDVDGRTVTFENQSKDATTFVWDFGDGSSSTEENPVHTYAADGTYAVVLTGTGSAGSKEATKNVIIDTNTPPDLAPAPTEPEANVISIYSDAYTDITGVNLNPNWGQATVTSEIEIAGEKVLKMAGLTYQGIDFAGNAQNVSGKTKLHVDVWCSVATTVNLSVIGNGENPVTLTTEAGVWKSFDILLSEYTVPDLSAVIQLKFDDAGTATSPTIYVDNIYFY